MRRPRFVWTAALTAVGFSALPAPAQQPSGRASSPPSTIYANTVSRADGDAADAASDPNVDPLMSNRAARYILRNGLDYLNYREYDRSLGFFRVAEKRQAELSDAERVQLRKGIARAQQGKREAINAPQVVAQPKGRPTAPPGTYALAPERPAGRSAAVAAAGATTNGRPRRANPPMAPEPVQLASATVVEAQALVAPDPVEATAPTPPALAPLPNPGPAVAPGVPSEPPPLDLPAVIAAPSDLPQLPAAPAQPLPDLSAPPPGGAAPTGSPEVAPATAGVPDLPPVIGAVDPAPGSGAPMAPPEAAPAPEPPTAALPMPTPEATPARDASARAAEATLPLPVAPEMTPVQDPAPVPAALPTPAVEPPPAAEVTPSPSSGPGGSAPPSPGGPLAVDLGRAAPGAGPAAVGSFSDSLLAPHQRAEIERLAQRGDNPASDRAAAATPTADAANSNTVGQGSTRLEIQRAPSPTEARPIRKIPVPEEFTNLPPRDWSANRKYFAAAATCHMTLYFQDPVLERYGQSVEQALGPRGRYFSYPLDDPRQSNQRNQILQPFWSMGKFAFQVGTLPYKLVVDPPWESEYDLGYYRPGDRIPPDTTVIFPTGVGPPGVGRRY